MIIMQLGSMITYLVNHMANDFEVIFAIRDIATNTKRVTREADMVLPSSSNIQCQSMKR